MDGCNLILYTFTELEENYCYTHRHVSISIRICNSDLVETVNADFIPSKRIL